MKCGAFPLYVQWFIVYIRSQFGEMQRERERERERERVLPHFLLMLWFFLKLMAESNYANQFPVFLLP